MYTNYNLEGQTHFQMPKEEFNTLINSLTREGGDMPVRIGVSFRTINSNLVAKEVDNLVFETDFTIEDSNNYFSAMLSIQKMMLDKILVEALNFQAIQHTILMPMGAYTDDKGMVIYFNILIEDDWLEAFKIKESIKFVPIKENTLSNLNKGSIIILPTLVSVK